MNEQKNIPTEVPLLYQQEVNTRKTTIELIVIPNRYMIRVKVDPNCVTEFQLQVAQEEAAQHLNREHFQEKPTYSLIAAATDSLNEVYLKTLNLEKNW